MIILVPFASACVVQSAQSSHFILRGKHYLSSVNTFVSAADTNRPTSSQAAALFPLIPHSSEIRRRRRSRSKRSQVRLLPGHPPHPPPRPPPLHPLHSPYTRPSISQRLDMELTQSLFWQKPLILDLSKMKDVFPLQVDHFFFCSHFCTDSLRSEFTSWYFED